ncbi:hypothetical protein [Streptomyces blattellae]|uniref:hypothetical protein n=1 Tax=Streptomyces blattellae TaxID=2569855 RepID=UPI0012B832DE|nr:hypothetical protein [Streptomyces blattellae]
MCHSVATLRLTQALRLLPVLLVVVLSTPAWLVWPFPPGKRQKFVLNMVRALTAWTYGPTRAELPDTDTASDAGK